uniref:Uncharacterized protein n=1 Tax=Lepeophtheirus salmonis TaxID=72036 RepID=A0A0K2VFZ9_LEPSM
MMLPRQFNIDPLANLYGFKDEGKMDSGYFFKNSDPQMDISANSSKIALHSIVFPETRSVRFTSLVVSLNE